MRTRSLARAALMVVLVLTTGTECGLPRHQTGGESNIWAPGTAWHEVTIDGEQRQFLLHIPAARPHRFLGILQGYPLILVLHGSGADVETVRDQTRMDSISDAFGWAVAYPSAVAGPLGFGSDWNAGTCCGIAAENRTDDVRFLASIIDTLSHRLTLDTRRVYVAGFSAGGRMAYHFACQASARLAAIAVVAGSIRDSACATHPSVPLISFHGTADEEVPYDEASDTPMRRRPLVTAAALPPAVQLWSSENECRRLLRLPVTKDVSRFQFIRCRADVVLYSIEGGHHGWPGEPDGEGSTPPMSEVNATALIAKFFTEHVR